MHITTTNQAFVSQAHSQMRFSFLKQSSNFATLVQKILGDSTYTRCLKNSDRRCEIFLNKDHAAGLIVYKIKLTSGNFKLKNFEPIQSELPLKDSANVLFNRVLKLAKRSSANGIIFDNPKTSDLGLFFKENKFQVMEETTKGTTLFLKLDLKKNGRISNAEEGLKERSSSLKRPRNSEANEDNEVVSKPAKRAKPTPQESTLPRVRRTYSESNLMQSSSNNTRVRSMSVPTRTSTPIKTHNLPMKGTEYFNYIMEGTKLYEGRVNAITCQRMNVGDHLKLFDGRARWGIVCEITSKDVYPSFSEMLSAKGIISLLPQLRFRAPTMSPNELLKAGINIYESFPGSNRVRQLGAVAIGVKFLQKVYQ